MLRRTPALVATLAAALATVAPATPARAAALGSDAAFGSTTFFELKNQGDEVNDVYARIDPAFLVALPPMDHASDPSVLPFTRGPLVVVDGRGNGFDPSTVTPHISGSGDGVTSQLLWLEFPDGLPKDGTLTFGLGSDPSYAGELALTLLSDPTTQAPLTTGNLSLVPVPPIELDSPVDPPTVTEAPPEVQVTSTPDAQVVPEPLTLVLWSTGSLALGLIRARAYRKAQRTA